MQRNHWATLAAILILALVIVTTCALVLLLIVGDLARTLDQLP